MSGGQIFSWGKKGRSPSQGGSLTRFFRSFFRKNHIEPCQYVWPNPCSPALIMMNAANSTSSPSFTTPAPFLNTSHIQEQQISPSFCLPEQFFTDATQSQAHWNGTRRLLFAVLQDAVACWFRYQRARSAQGRQLFREIRDWFLTTNRDSLYSFENICIHLNLNADYFRRGLMGSPTNPIAMDQRKWTSAHRPGHLTRRRS